MGGGAEDSLLIKCYQWRGSKNCSLPSHCTFKWTCTHIIYFYLSNEIFTVILCYLILRNGNCHGYFAYPELGSTANTGHRNDYFSKDFNFF